MNDNTRCEPNSKTRPAGLGANAQDAIEVSLWEAHLDRSRTNLAYVLSTYSLDNGPRRQIVNRDHRVAFRFLVYDWERTINHLLVHVRTPFEIIGHFQIDVLQHLAKKKVYIAEDDLDVLFTINTMLETHGYDVTVAHCGAPLLEKYLPAIDLLIIDKRMPDVDGLEVCRYLRAQPASKDVPIVMISAMRNFAEGALKEGVNECLEKPFNMNDLLAVVSKHTVREFEHVA